MFLYIQANCEFNVLPCNNLDVVFKKETSDHTSVWLYGQSNPKPVTDSFSTIYDNCVYFFDGVLVNSKKLLNNYALADNKKLIMRAMHDDSYSILKCFHGQFCGLFIDTKSSVVRVFTNQTNSMRVYYYVTSSVIIAGTSLKLINNLLAANGIKTGVDETGARMLLKYGYMLSDFTTIKEIRHLQAGNCLVTRLWQTKIDIYHRFNNDIKHRNTTRIVSDLQSLFEDAVTSAFEKDNAYGKKHLAFLSGGLDSRQTVMTAYDLGFKQIQCLNFSQPGYADELIARKIAASLGLELMFVSLKDGSYLLNLDDNLQYNEGQIVLHGAAHLYYGISKLNLDDYGILHSGLLGDALLGSYLSEPYHIKPVTNAGGYSDKVDDLLQHEVSNLSNAFDNQEMFLFYNRGFNAIMNGDYACELHSYSVSPFLETEFAQYCLNIDPALRFKNQCYRQWMLKYNRKGAGFTWEKYGSSLLIPEKLVRMKYLIMLGTNKLRRVLTGVPDKRSMNPFELWWSQNSELVAFFNRKMETVNCLKSLISNALREDITVLYNTGNVHEKMLAYSLIAGLKYLYSEVGTY